MSARTNQTIAVLFEVWIRRGALAAVRARAENLVAQRLGRRRETVHDKLVRQLQPEVRSVDDLDALIFRWLGGDPEPLHNTLLAHAGSARDRGLIDAFFSRPGAEPTLPVDQGTPGPAC